jgi:hypothetical protein
MPGGRARIVPIGARAKSRGCGTSRGVAACREALVRQLSTARRRLARRHGSTRIPASSRWAPGAAPEGAGCRHGPVTDVPGVARVSRLPTGSKIKRVRACARATSPVKGASK